MRPPDAGIHVETFRAITTAEAVATIMESIFMSVDLCVFLCLGGSKPRVQAHGLYRICARKLEPRLTCSATVPKAAKDRCGFE